MTVSFFAGFVLGIVTMLVIDAGIVLWSVLQVAGRADEERNIP